MTILWINIAFAAYNSVVGGLYFWHVRKTKQEITGHATQLKAEAVNLHVQRQAHLGKSYKRCADCDRLLANYEEIADGTVRCIDTAVCERVRASQSVS